MWWKLKAGASGVILVISLVWMIEDLANELWWQALGTLAAGIVVALGALAINEDNAPVLITPMVGIFTMAGWFHVFSESPAANVGRQQGLASLFAAFTTLFGATGLSQAEQDMVFKGMTACAIQPTQDQFAMTTEAMKARYETPLMSMTDRATGIGNPPPSPEECIHAYRELRPLMPDSFIQAEKESPWLLDQLQKQ